MQPTRGVVVTLNEELLAHYGPIMALYSEPLWLYTANALKYDL